MIRAQYFAAREQYNAKTRKMESRSAFLAVAVAEATAEVLMYDGRRFSSVNRDGEQYTSRDGKAVLYYEVGGVPVTVTAAE